MNEAERSQLLQYLCARRDAVAEHWYRAIAHTSFAPLSVAEVRQHLVDLTEQVITLLLADPFDCRPAQIIGATLASLHFVTPVALGNTHEALARELVAGLPTELAVVLHLRLIALLGALATGFVMQAHTMVLAEQEQIHRAVFIQLKRMEATRRQSEARFRAVFEEAALGIALVDMEGRAIETNPALRKMLGYSGNELRGMQFTEFTHPDDVAVDMDLYKELVAGKRDHYQMEKRYIRRDGRVVWGRLTVSLVQCVEGDLQYAIGMVEDITERTHVESRLVMAQRRLAESEGSKLTERELAVMQLIVSGKTEKEIGKALSMSDRSVRNYIRRACRRLKVENRNQAAAKVVQLGLVKE
jgi:PAS domain S-box-containing protein